MEEVLYMNESLTFHSQSIDQNTSEPVNSAFTKLNIIFLKSSIYYTCFPFFSCVKNEW